MKKFVVKFGTRTLMSKSGKLDPDIFQSVAKQVAEASSAGVGIAIVSSGAIQAGRETITRLGLDHSFSRKFNKKDIAGIGSRHLMNSWGDSLNKFGMEVCETLVTFANWTDGNERENIRKGIIDCFGTPFVPVINENDRVSDEEIKMMEKGISENDQLARMIAILIDADGVLFITEVGGIYDSDPLKNSNAKILKKINGLLKPDVTGCSREGTGGMKVKRREAIMCLEGGVKKVAIAGMNDRVIIDFIEGNKVGTEVCL